MQLEKAKETKQDMERCRLLAQRIAEELAPATAAVLNAETPALEKALHRAGVDLVRRLRSVPCVTLTMMRALAHAARMPTR